VGVSDGKGVDVALGEGLDAGVAVGIGVVAAQLDRNTPSNTASRRRLFFTLSSPRGLGVRRTTPILCS
jgi:hypothetical protein